MQQFERVGVITACLYGGRKLCLETSRFQIFWETLFPDINAKMYVTKFYVFFYPVHFSIIV